MEGYGALPPVYPLETELEDVDPLSRHRRSFQENITLMDEQIAAITGIGYQREVDGPLSDINTPAAGQTRQHSITSIWSSGYSSSATSPEGQGNQQSSSRQDNSEIPPQQRSNSLVTALLTNKKPLTDDFKKGWWDPNLGKKRQEHPPVIPSLMDSYSMNYVQAQYQPPPQQSFYNSSYDSMFPPLNPASGYYSAPINQERQYASIQQFANYAALQLEQASREAQYRDTRYLAMQHYGQTLGNVYENQGYRAASAIEGPYSSQQQVVRSSSTPDALRNRHQNLAANERMQWLLQHPGEMTNAIMDAFQPAGNNEAAGFAPPPGINGPRRVRVPPPPGFEKLF